MRNFAVLLLILLGNRANAEPLTDLYARKIASLERTREIESAERDYFHLQVARRACKLELTEKLVPVSCFEALERETRWGMHSSRQRRFLRQKLDKICGEAAARLRLSDTISLRDLSTACRDSVHQALKIRAYRDAKSWSGS